MYWLVILFLALASPLAKAKLCDNLPPGLAKMTRGVDISKLDLLPIDVVGDDGVMSPVFSLTCDQGKKWRSVKGTVYDLPDHIWQMTTVPGGWMSSEARTYKSYSEVRNSMGTNVGLGADVGKYSFSASVSYKKMQSSITSSSRYISDITAFVAATRADVNPPEKLELDEYALNYVNTKLPKTFETNPAAYKQFIQTYGTHYFTTANFGGFIRMVFETNTAYFNSKSESEIEANAKASYMKMVSVSVGVSSSSGNVDESFTSNTKSSIKYYGGDLNVLASGGLSKWQPTVEGDPWLFTGKLKPISDLIKDPAKRLSMERAVKKHLLQAYITEQETLINVARAKSDNSVINSLLSRVAALKRKYNNNLLDKFKTIVYIPQNDNSDIDALARDLQEYVSVPSWFLTNTQMCLYWKGTSDWYQCNGNGNQGLCAITNSMTPWYIDWTNWRAGGCMMQWAIISANFPAWFNDVKICYQFYAEIDIRQCGGNAGAVYCANVNNYTPEYFDDTGDRNGGCRMRWMLQVPDTAPYWMKAVHMCYNWVADGDIAQCGGGAPTSQCVVANQWTTYYLDYSGMKWQGGCKMSWGLKTVY